MRFNGRFSQQPRKISYKIELGCVLSAFLAVCSLPITTVSDVTCKITDYGITKLSTEHTIINDPRSPTGKRRIPAAATVILATDRIPARTGVSFGITYEINNLPLGDGAVVDVLRAVRFPAMVKPDGSTWSRYEGLVELRVKNGRAIGQSGYSFEHDYELVPGVWKFEVRFNGKTVCKKHFTVFVE